MKKILFVANYYYPNVIGGAEISVQTLAEELARRDIGVAVISLAGGQSDSVDAVNGIKVYRMAVENIYSLGEGGQSAGKRLLWHIKDRYNAAMAAKVDRILEIERPDWVSTHNLMGFSVAVWERIKARGIGLSHMLHDYYLMCPRTTMFHNNDNCAIPCTVCGLLGTNKRAASHCVDVVIGISKHVLDVHLARNYFPRSKAVVIHNARAWNGPPDTLPFVPRDATLKIGFIGRVEESKGIEVLLKAVSRLPEGRCIVRVAGRAEPEYLEYLRRTYPRPQVEYLGFVQSLDFYPTIDLLVIPSMWHEPLGMVACESLGYGVPVVASDVGGLPEILRDSGAGWLFKVGDDEHLSKLLADVMADPQRLTPMRARALDRRKYYVPQRQANDFIAAVGALTA